MSSSKYIYQVLTQNCVKNVLSLNELKQKYRSDNLLNPSVNVMLRRAAHAGNIDDIETLVLKYRAQINEKSSNGLSALEWAYLSDKMEAVDLLRWLDADDSQLCTLVHKYMNKAETQLPNKNITLCRAAQRGNAADIERLITRYQANCQCLNENGQTPLSLAQQGRHKEAEKMLHLFLPSVSKAQEDSPVSTISHMAQRL